MARRRFRSQRNAREADLSPFRAVPAGGGDVEGVVAMKLAIKSHGQGVREAGSAAYKAGRGVVSSR